MPSTSNRGYSVPATGTQSGIWGSDDLNPNFEKIDDNLGATASVVLSSSNVILSAAEYNCGTIILSGALLGNLTVTWPSVSGWWTVYNLCTGNFFVRIQCSVPGAKICPPPGQCTDVFTDGTNMYYRSLPHNIGGYWDYAGSSTPLWVSNCTVPPYLLCDGSTFSAVTYPYLNTILGGTTLPDHRGRSRIALDGGTNRVTTAGSGIDGATRFAAGGAQNVTLTEAQLAAHAHTLTTNGAHTHTVGPLLTSNPNQGSGGSITVYVPSAGTLTSSSNGDHTHTVGSTGGGTSHNNMQPTVVGGIVLIRAA